MVCHMRVVYRQLTYNVVEKVMSKVKEVAELVRRIVKENEQEQRRALGVEYVVCVRVFI
jgi:hypothetical protein